jgi:uncharacterized protein
MAQRPPVPPFTAETAAQKVRAAEDAWNTRDPNRVSLAYTEDSRWRNRSQFINDVPIAEADRKFRWDRSGPRPQDHPGLSDLGL